MTAALIFTLIVAAAVVVVLILDVRAAEKKLRGEQMRADAASADAARARSAQVIAEENRDRAVLGYSEILGQVAELALHLRANHHDIAAKQLDRLVDDRTGALRRL